MSIGDFNTYLTNDKAPTNIMTATPVSEGKPELAAEAFLRIASAHVKARSCIKVVLGDMYYQELDKDQVIKSQITTLPDGMLKTQEDVEKFVSEHISKPMPFEKP